jgi:hypothetical protein
VRITWNYRDPKTGWIQYTPSPPLLIRSGGREQGFRTFGYLSKWKPGWWRADIEAAADGRDIGWITVNVIPEEGTDERWFQYDMQ